MKVDITKEIIFQTARSGGKGGQNVNKVETMVEGRWNVQQSQLVTEEQKKIIAEKLANRITEEGMMLVKAQHERTQLGNKLLVIKKMNTLVNLALQPQKRRIATKTPGFVKERRIENKKYKSVIKEFRRKTKPHDY